MPGGCRLQIPMTGSVVHDNGRSLIMEDRGQRHKEHSYVLLRHAALEYLVVQDTDVGRHRHQKRDVAATLGAHHAVHPFALYCFLDLLLGVTSAGEHLVVCKYHPG